MNLVTPLPGGQTRPGRLAQRVALITGGAGDIGQAAAIHFVEQGAKVALADLNEDRGQAIAVRLRSFGGDVAFFKADLRDDAAVKSMVHDVVKLFGQLHVLFNCAGGSSPQDTCVTEVDLDVWDQSLSVNLTGTMLSCRHAIPEIVKAGGGSVINMSSGAALLGNGKAHAYSAAKAAIGALTRSLAASYASKNIRVNAICAGRINTERVRSSYGMPGLPGKNTDLWNINEIVRQYPFWVGEPEDIANIALFLASNESRMITGAEIPANGGRTAY